MRQDCLADTTRFRKNYPSIGVARSKSSKSRPLEVLHCAVFGAVEADSETPGPPIPGAAGGKEKHHLAVDLGPGGKAVSL